MNTFWYRFWYSDTNYANNVNHDRNFTKLINLYIYYGLSVPHNMFYSNYWYKTSYKTLNAPKYYRRLTLKNRVLGVDTNYRLRNKTTDVYPMKLWILKYDHWIIINFYWFQPNKKKITWKFRSGRQHEVVQIEKQSVQVVSNIRKIKTILSNNMMRLYLKKQYFSF